MPAKTTKAPRSRKKSEKPAADAQAPVSAALATTSTSEAPLNTISGEILAGLILNSDLKALSLPQRVEYVIGLCRREKIDPALKPFELIEMNGKLVPYANKSCTEQLRTRDKISLTITSREFVESVYIVTARATTPEGRTDESAGAVAVKNARGEFLNADAIANAVMKAETKAKRRVTLSICGLGMMDESEIDVAQMEQDRQANQLAAKREEMQKSLEANGGIGTPVTTVTKPAPATVSIDVEVEQPKKTVQQPSAAPKAEPKVETPAPKVEVPAEPVVEKATLQKDDLGSHVIKTVATPTYLNKMLSELSDEELRNLFNSWANKPEYIEKFKNMPDKRDEAQKVRDYAKARLHL